MTHSPTSLHTRLGAGRTARRSRRTVGDVPRRWRTGHETGPSPGSLRPPRVY